MRNQRYRIDLVEGSNGLWTAEVLDSAKRLVFRTPPESVIRARRDLTCMEAVTFLETQTSFESYTVNVKLLPKFAPVECSPCFAHSP